MKNFFSREVLLSYVYSVFTGRMLGFIVGMWATNIVSHFFATRSIQNLWGVASKGKTVVDKATFANLEWVASVIIGFFVFEIVHKLVREKLSVHGTVLYNKIQTSIKENGVKETAKISAVKSYEYCMKNRIFRERIHPVTARIKINLKDKI